MYDTHHHADYNDAMFGNFPTAVYATVRDPESHTQTKNGNVLRVALLRPTS